MSHLPPNANVESATMIYCPQCGQAMRVRAEHLQTAVACPHCQETLDPWRFVATMAPGQSVPAAPPPPPVRLPQAHAAYLYSPRNRWVAGALGVLLGTFGVHRFYLGYTGIGIIQVIVCVLTLGTVSSIWGFIEGILCFCGAMRDANGLPLRD